MRKTIVNLGNGPRTIEVESIGNDINVEVYDQMTYLDLNSFCYKLKEEGMIKQYKTSTTPKLGKFRVDITVKDGIQGTLQGIWLLERLNSWDVLKEKK